MKLIMCKGLPGSGKSTWARSQHLSIMVVNKDDIRAGLTKTGWVWSPSNEKDVIKQRDQLITMGLKKGLVVISDDTNLAPKHQVALEALAKRCGSTFMIQDFTTTVTLAECIRRDSLRVEGKVGEKVIRDMYRQYLEPRVLPAQVVPYFNDPKLPPAVICDLDGTLCIHNGRGPFDYDKCDTDLINHAVDMVLMAMSQQGHEIIFMSGREDSCRDLTLKWLSSHGWDNPLLFMRQAKDFRKDWIVKTELFNTHVRDKFMVEFVLDDRDQVVKMWRDMGLTCLQVNYGNF